MPLGVQCVFWDFGVGEFEFGFLFRGWVGGRAVCGEGVYEVLFVVLFDVGGEGLEAGEDVVGYGEGELLGCFDGEGKGNAEELGRTKETFSWAGGCSFGMEEALTWWDRIRRPQLQMAVLTHLSYPWLRSRPLSQWYPH